MAKKLVVSILVVVVLFLGTFLLAQEWKYVGIVAADASRDETGLTVEAVQPIQVGRLIMIESRDGKRRETYLVRHVYDHTVILESPLVSPYVSGSKLYQ